ncbi:hypothetical protein KM914_21085 [Virgibacillus pantothenticus]|uniref:hypothetical protein n=1 Tax=Virgibacillus pantothenticus TaxID=1473 RepID=UPI001C243B6C|nr:hypothetical protein [Virgibacillus pantothenticus]MBU8568863.1 hypothetical protein [Virgibacillus pantothenticus]MBU8601899.1 hypothetical protein [Virgibacillus pantothenticus]MBU8636008.1 hypothetical protein [Virgibacillus pantothenticus]MBU8644758.1 hypothetical protein [Virgibacillus pantothenticus]MBU8647962.1 hypothetical protein [Virgibacillus pantothenticus]
MNIDFSPLELTMSDIAFDLAKLLGIPFIISLAVGLVLEILKGPKGLIRFIAPLIFLLSFAVGLKIMF